MPITLHQDGQNAALSGPAQADKTNLVKPAGNKVPTSVALEVARKLLHHEKKRCSLVPHKNKITGINFHMLEKVEATF